MILEILIPYLALINILGFWSMGRDKSRAIKGRSRIPEKSLFAYALLGGGIGCLLGMSAFRHKTKKLSFTLGIPIILIVQILIAAMIYRFF